MSYPRLRLIALNVPPRLLQRFRTLPLCPVRAFIPIDVSYQHTEKNQSACVRDHTYHT